MYCPRCGEQQTSGNLRFCSKCGLPLGLVSEVLSNGGTLPQLEEIYKKKKFLTRKNGVIFSIFWFIFFVPFCAAFFGVLRIEELSAVSAVFGVFSSLLILLFSLFFLGKPPQDSQNQVILKNNNAIPQNLSGQQTQQNVLPSQQTQSAQEYVAPSAASWKTYDTGELVQPGSVTEGTTKLLKKEIPEEETKYLNEK
ncbi:MAG: hypothetical protein ACR2MD_03905 [Aridibacter sp.]